MMPGMQTQDGIGQIQERSVLVLVVNWNGADMTRDCCASLAAQTHRNLHVRVVDNGSTRDTVEALRAACPGAEVVGTGRNLGFAGGVNAGLRAGEGAAPFDYVWLLNNDTVCDPDALGRLLSAAEADRRLTVEVQPGMAAQHEVEAGPLTAGGRRTPGAAILADMEDRGFELEPADEPLGDAVGVGIHRRCYLKTRGSLQVLPIARQKRTNKKWIAYLPR